MGILQGKVQGDTFVVIDSFALPVEGTETRVNAQARARETAPQPRRRVRAVRRSMPRTCPATPRTPPAAVAAPAGPGQD
jgi:hypothetical protein